MCVFNIDLVMFSPLEFIYFIKDPKYISLERKSTHILRTSIKIYLLLLLIVGLINSLNLTILKAVLTLPVDNSLVISDSYKKHICFYLITVAFFAPIMEETIFRLPLIFKPINLSLSISILIALIIQKLAGHIVAIIFFILIFLPLISLSNTYNQILKSFWTNNFKFIFYFSSILFGLVHLSNYTYFENSQYLIIPILILPQLILGFLLSFIRMYYKKGLLMCIIIHSLINLVSVSIYLLEYSQKI